MPVRQRGQAIAFVLVTTVIVLLGVVLLYNVSQLTTQKMKLQNTADAAAYSGAVTEARDYNFSAYANRAMVANQVAIAQIVGLTSWARNLDSSFKSGPMAWMPETMANLSFLSFMYTIPANIIKAIAGPLKTGMETAGKVLTIALDILIAGLYYATTAYHAAMILTVPQTVSDVVTANDPDAEVSLSVTQVAFAAKHVVDWYNFTTDGITRSYDATATQGGKFDSVTGGSQDRMANVIWNSQDGFYSRSATPGDHRSYPWTSVPVISPYLIDPTKFFVPFNNGPALMFMYHSGGTELKTTNVGNRKHRQWAAMDVTGLFTLFVVWIMIVLVPIPIPIPIPTPQGWGGALAGAAMTTALQPVDNLNHNFAQSWGGAFVNPLTIAPAGIQAAAGPGGSLDSRGGLRITGSISSYLDVRNRAQASSTANQNTSGPELIIEVRKPADTIRTSTTMSIGGGAGGRLYLEDGTEGAHLKAISKAHAYFSRPKKLFPRPDGKTEYGSLYSPYWQARLLPNSLLEQGASILTQ